MSVSQPITAWEVSGTSPWAHSQPSELDQQNGWIAAAVPGTVASALRAAGRWNGDDQVDLDASDWWFRASFDADPTVGGRLRFGGIATIADVWVDGDHVLHSENMFVPRDVTVDAGSHHEVVVVCRSLDDWLQTRRPRPRWKTRLVANQQLRWARTTLIGRMPTWPPRAAPVGLWREVEFIADDVPVLDGKVLTAHLAGENGVVSLEASLTGTGGVEAAWIAACGRRERLDVSGEPGAWKLRGSVVVPDPVRWWPHTHGDPTLHHVSVEVSLAGGERRTLPAGTVGFRTVIDDRTNDGFGLVVNGVAIFCRGACWVPLDPVALVSTESALETAVRQAVEGGMNMLRITGTMVYEQDALYDLCDRFGVLLWHDLMFANMDYPLDDSSFAANVHDELTQFLLRVRHHPCIAVVCGGSEVEQQAVMMGVDTVSLPPGPGRALLPAVIERTYGTESNTVVSVPCSPSGGVFPFSIATGISHYYGVGAYQRPLQDARRAGVRFTTECLAFSNVPTRESLIRFLDAGDSPAHSPKWKEGVPRDRSAGWDFEDVRDHYVREIFAVDPAEVRYSDPDRYLDLGRAAVAIAIEATLAEWRRPGSPCDGALIFTLRDLRDGAGWGLVDAAGRPKSAFHAAARANAPVAVLVTDEGLDGLAAHLVNDRPVPFAGTLAVRVYTVDGALGPCAEQAIELPPHGSLAVSVDGMFAGFRDLTYAFRFGPLVHDVVCVELRDAAGARVSDAFHLPAGHGRQQHADVGLSAAAVAVDGGVELALRTEQFAHFISIVVPGHLPDADWFHLAPGDQRTIRCCSASNPRRAPIEVRALNSRRVVVLGTIESLTPERKTS